MFEDKFIEVLKRHVPLLGDHPDSDLSLRNAGLSSLNAINLILDIEEAYDIQFDDEDLVNDIYSTPQTLWNVVNKLLCRA